MLHHQDRSGHAELTRRTLFAGAGLAVGAVALTSAGEGVAQQPSEPSATPGGEGYATASDGARLYYKDWGRGQPIFFHHGWPLTADDWDGQMLYFLSKGYRVIAMDRRGHGRSSQTATGNDMDTYAADVDAVVRKLDLRDAIHIGHSTGGGEVARYVARHGQGRVAKAVLVSSVPPIMLKTPDYPGGLPRSVFDGFRAQLAANRADFYWQVPIPFYGFNRPGKPVIEGVRQNWWRQGMMGGAKAHYDCIKAFSETDQTADLKEMGVPTLILQGDDDQIVPYQQAALLQAKLVPNGKLKIYPGFSHGMLTLNGETINPDILSFLKS
ncbi:alpha/beta fold hydrolase [Sphingomonas sp. SORGH_AS_0879]|uniref:alpha/beta fold hydrolase n=1 Tax=Sphingomonas sp. SORGH_AS_0879 TaxID=3041790 RepID=UPI00277EB02B|nr:alpha/beta hydrolase [Sphingomonas sp. SORGH_AS_0879]MDQ1229168.1 non-heme chloroperoxidase [Sphingomonas sp. SORGH_AS_0879]